MVRSSLTRQPKEQRCHYLIGPVSSWFMPNTSDIWSQPKTSATTTNSHQSLKVSPNLEHTYTDCYEVTKEENASLSYFIYGSIGCFCYGEIHHHANFQRSSQSQSRNNPTSAAVTHLVDIKDDNSRVSCIRFLKTLVYPTAVVLTESGSLVIHDCLRSLDLIHIRKSELLNKLIGRPLQHSDESTSTQHCNKKAKLNVIQQINSFVWPTPTDIFFGISLFKEKKNILVWLKLKDIFDKNDCNISGLKDDFILSKEHIDLESPQYSSPICCMESAMLDKETCVVATATDDGLITVICLNISTRKLSRVIKLARHNDQICSLSFYTGNSKKFPLGILASVSRNGLVLLWDIENEFYFADFQASLDGSGRTNTRINWFSVRFIFSETSENVHLAVSNCDSGLSVLELPENTRSKIRLKESKDVKGKKASNYQQLEQQTIRHHALLFDIAFDPRTQTILTSSLDGNHILWRCQRICATDNSNQKRLSGAIDLKPCFLLPSLPNNSRTHMIRHSAIKDDFAAIALGKAGLRFYKLAKSPTMRRFDMDGGCSMIARKVNKLQLSPTSVSWHPSHEYRLAVGTLEGKVLRVDITPRKASIVVAEHRPIVHSWITREASKTSKTEVAVDDLFDVDYQPIEHELENDNSSSVSRSTTDGVYSICWGPDPTDEGSLARLAIYAIGSLTHRLFIYSSKKDVSDKITNLLDDYDDQSIPEAIGEASEVAWKSSMDIMALGTTTGKVIILGLSKSTGSNGCLNLFMRIAVIQGPLGCTPIQCIAWHPTTDRDDPFYYQIATSANASPVFVFNVKESVLVAEVRRLNINEQQTSGESSVNGSLTTTISNYIYRLEAHKKAVTDIAWSPHDSNIIATSSFDRNCYVWSLTDAQGFDMIDASITSKFIGRDRLFTLEWSLVDSDLIFTSGHDSTIWSWRPSENLAQKDSATQD